MWAISNQTRFKVERSFVRDKDGAEIWLVAVRGTFEIAIDGGVALAEQQQDVCLAPKFFGDASESGLRYDSDLVRTKSGTDVVLHGTAYAPEGIPTRSVDVSLSVGPISKSLRVFGDRVWDRGWSDVAPGDPQPFTSLPIRYERAWGGLLPRGGRHWHNPIGIGAGTGLGEPVPNIEYPSDPIRSPHYRTLPAGFGPIPCHWQPRLELAGTYDESWRRERQPLVPVDFQDAYFRCAPTDQQVHGFLQGGEEVVLRNLTPAGLFRFHLPRVHLGFRTQIDGGSTHHRGQIHTIVIEPDEHRLVIVWHTALPCHHTLYALKETLVFEKEHRNLVVLEPELDSVA